MITITDAATVKLRELISSQEQPDLYLRLFIAPGGCEGFSYGMAFDTERHEDDQVIERGGVLVLVEVSTVRTPNAVAPCGCGHSFRTKHDAGQPQSCDCDTPESQKAPETQQA